MKTWALVAGAIASIGGLLVLAVFLVLIRDDGTPGDRTFSQDFFLQLADNVFGALFTGLFVAGGAAIAVWYLQRRAEGRTEARELEHEYVRRASEVAGALYLETQKHWRRVENPEMWGDTDRAGLEAAYDAFALNAAILEQELASRYGWESRPRQTWHQVWDLLTVRYYDLRNRPQKGAGLGLLRVNARGHDGELHSGLTTAELGDAKTLLTTYHRALAQFHRDLADQRTGSDRAGARPDRG